MAPSFISIGLNRYKKNLAGLVVVQASQALHSFFDFSKLFLSPKVKLLLSAFVVVDCVC